MTVRTPVDALALVPVVLGFQPADSVVLLTFGGEGFHARVDLPLDAQGCCEVVQVLTQALRANPCRVVMVLLYTDDEQAAAALTGLLLPALLELDLAVADVVRADGEQWWSVTAAGDEGRGTVYDNRSHPFTADAVLRGTVVRGSREELAEVFVPDDLDLVEQVQQAVDAQPPAFLPPPGPARRQLAVWLRRTVERWCDAQGPSGTPVGPAEDVARVLALIDHPSLREVVWGSVGRDDADRHREVWTAVLRSSPYAWSASPAALVGLYAWLGGDGALAWTAVERAREVDPDHSLADLVAEALERAVPPSSWRPWRHEELLDVHG